MSEQSLTRFQCSQQDFLCWFVTTDETWVHYYTPETKQQLKQWKHADSPPSKKAKAVRSAGKCMASVFWDAIRILLIDYLPTGQIITGQYHLIWHYQLKVFLGGQRFSTMEELAAEVEGHFAVLDESDFDRIKALEYRLTNCISLQGDYVEK